MNTLRDAIDAVGGVGCASRIVNLSQKAIYKWLATGCLPRSEYTGETRYSEQLAKNSYGKFTAEQLREVAARPVRTVA